MDTCAAPQDDNPGKAPKPKPGTPTHGGRVAVRAIFNRIGAKRKDSKR